MAIFDRVQPKIIDLTFSFPELYQHAKNQFNPSALFLDTVSFRIP